MVYNHKTQKYIKLVYEIKEQSQKGQVSDSTVSSWYEPKSLHKSLKPLSLKEGISNSILMAGLEII
jgi:hypothetical protein